VSQQSLLTLLALNMLVGALSYLLFPYLWRG
jgi:heme exporter protein B